VPVHADANELPYADEYFDAVVSVDAYLYFGRDAEYLINISLPSSNTAAYWR